MTSGLFGSGALGSDPYGSGFPAFGVTSATSLGGTLVEVVFSDPINFSNPAFLAPSNFTIPGLTVLTVTTETAQSVRLVTVQQTVTTYEVSVTFALSINGLYLNPVLRTATFIGSPVSPSFIAAGMTPTRVRLLFSAPMLLNSALTSMSSYEVTTLQGDPLTVLAVDVEQATNPLSLILTLASPGMATTEWYQVEILGGVQTETMLTPSPLQMVFQFIQPSASFDIDPRDFTGEVQGGLFGTPHGLVFFSPALQAPVPNSILQVEDIDVCSTAYDKYHFPELVDPSPFFTWSPQGPQTTLGQTGVVLWAAFPRLFEARFELTFQGPQMVDHVPQMVDSGCSILMRTMWDPAYVSLLNDPAWWLFDGTHDTTPPMFICANNLAPIPPGPEVITVLRTAFGGNSTMPSSVSLGLGPTGVLGGGASISANPTVT